MSVLHHLCLHWVSSVSLSNSVCLTLICLLVVNATSLYCLSDLEEENAELKAYIDQLLKRVMEANPGLLMHN